MRRFFIRSLLSLCLVAASVLPASAQSLLDREWMAQATPAKVQALLGRTDVNARTEGGDTPLLLAAASNKDPAVAALLIDRGANINARNRIGLTPLHVSAAFNKTPAVIALLLDRGADINAQTEDGDTPLHAAALGNAPPAVFTLLLDRGADATLRSKSGELPIDYVDENAAIKGTQVYWRLNDARF